MAKDGLVEEVVCIRQEADPEHRELVLLERFSG